VALELAQVITELIEAVGALGEVEAGEHRMVDLLCRPAAEMTAAMQEDFEETDDPRFVDLDAGVTNRTNGDRQG